MDPTIIQVRSHGHDMNLNIDTLLSQIHNFFFLAIWIMLKSSPITDM